MLLTEVAVTSAAVPDTICCCTLTGGDSSTPRPSLVNGFLRQLECPLTVTASHSSPLRQAITMPEISLEPKTTCKSPGSVSAFGLARERRGAAWKTFEFL